MQNALSNLLIAEHDVILEAGDLISSNDNLWQSRPAEYKQLVKQLLSFFSQYADEYHHLKEEKILFPAIEKKTEMAASAIVTELLEHHENFRELIGQIKTKLDAGEFAEVQALLKTYISQLKDHIAVENDELFPMADDLFNREEGEKLFHLCIDKDTELGISRKKELENIIKKYAIT